MEASKKSSNTLPLRSLNHVSRVCKDVQKTAAFYKDVLGFVEIKRPSSFDFEGSWLFNYNIGIHLIKGEPHPRAAAINPKSDHLSFQADCLYEAEKRLKQCSIEYVRATVEEGGIRVSQIFFHDPDNNMIEICNCDCLPVIPLSEQDTQVPHDTHITRSMRSPRQEMCPKTFAPSSCHVKTATALAREGFSDTVAISQKAGW